MFDGEAKKPENKEIKRERITSNVESIDKQESTINRIDIFK